MMGGSPNGATPNPGANKGTGTFAGDAPKAASSMLVLNTAPQASEASPEACREGAVFTVQNRGRFKLQTLACSIP